MYSALGQTMMDPAMDTGIAAPAPAAPLPAQHQFLHNLGKVLQNVHSAQQGGGSDGADNSNPYAVNFNPTSNANFENLGNRLMGNGKPTPTPST